MGNFLYNTSVRWTSKSKRCRLFARAIWLSSQRRLNGGFDQSLFDSRRLPKRPWKVKTADEIPVLQPAEESLDHKNNTILLQKNEWSKRLRNPENFLLWGNLAEEYLRLFQEVLCIDCWKLHGGDCTASSPQQKLFHFTSKILRLLDVQPKAAVQSVTFWKETLEAVQNSPRMSQARNWELWRNRRWHLHR